jgi:hypothetical protein
MYQDVEPKPEGAIFPKRSKPQGEKDSTPHDTGTSMEDQPVAVNIQGEKDRSAELTKILVFGTVPG